jgi:hypothetical protein
VTVADGQLFEGKGKVSSGLRLHRTKNAVKSVPCQPRPSVESALGAAAWIKRARSAWDFVWGRYGDWLLAA